jgi:hypothetical protein
MSQLLSLIIDLSHNLSQQVLHFVEHPQLEEELLEDLSLQLWLKNHKQNLNQLLSSSQLEEGHLMTMIK